MNKKYNCMMNCDFGWRSLGDPLAIPWRSLGDPLVIPW